MSDSSTQRANRLLHEKSPYLQQHAHNPVDWYPWGPEAFEAARKSNRPIFLSIGYSTCHWCHVMAHESFENPEIAAIMNDRYINIKLDREERPDVDALYMTAVQALTGGGGWPMSVWLTPDLKPFFGGTYFPPEDRYGRPGFPTVLLQLSEIYEKEHDRVAEVSKQIEDVLHRAAGVTADGESGLPAPGAAAEAAFRTLEAGFDSLHGGFGPAPKFPMPVYHDFLLRHADAEPKGAELSAFTVRKMGEGGLYDQLGGGWSRYSTDERWLVPHFEKMLYDNAQLVRVCARLFVRTRDPFFERLVRETAAYLLRDLVATDGAFYSAEDADSEGKEGAFYLWTLAEFTRVLGDDAEFMADVFGVTLAGNFVDPHTREAGKNVLSLAVPPAEVGRRRGLSAEAAAEIFSRGRERLFAERSKRPRPHRDEKILTEWNGLAISAFAQAGFGLNEPAFIAAAERAADFIHGQLYDPAARRLYRRWRDGDRAVAAQLNDHATLIEGLLDLFEATGEPRWLSWAIDLQTRQDDLFLDPAGGYFMSRADSDLIIRMKEDGDGVIPSGNSVAAVNGVRLAALTGRESFRAAALTTMKAFSATLRERPVAACRMIDALEWEQRGHVQIVIAGGPTVQGTSEMLDVLRRTSGVRRSVVLIQSAERQKSIAELIPHLADVRIDPARASATVCKNFVCQPPLATAADLEKAL